MDRQEAMKLWGKPRRKRLTPEACLHLTVAEHLRLAATPGTWFLHIPNEGKRTPAEGAHLKRLGMVPGAADLLIFVEGLAPTWFEIKAKGKTPSEEQYAFGEHVMSCGHGWAWADNITDALRILREYGALKPEAQFRRKAA